MIIDKNILNAANILVSDDPYSPGMIVRKMKDGIVEVYAINGYFGIKITCGSYPHEDYPVLADENFDYSEVEDFCVEIALKEVEQIKKIHKKSHIPILNSIFISEAYDSHKEEGFALTTDLSSTSKIKFTCKNGKEGFDRINYFIEKSYANESKLTITNFNPFYMCELLKCMNDILGISKKKYVAVTLSTGEAEYDPIRLKLEKDGIVVEGFLMPCVK